MFRFWRRVRIRNTIRIPRTIRWQNERTIRTVRKKSERKKKSATFSYVIFFLIRPSFWSTAFVSVLREVSTST
ncbi:hypothetical protein IQC45_22575 [Leptospira interrogans serovar Pomona]|nr:hypothetical protein [Leptospira interrogans serovar Pomona]